MEIENKPLAGMLAKNMTDLLDLKSIKMWEFSKMKTQERKEKGLPFSHRTLKYLEKGLLYLRGKRLEDAAKVLGIDLDIEEKTTINITIK